MLEAICLIRLFYMAPPGTRALRCNLPIEARFVPYEAPNGITGHLRFDVLGEWLERALGQAVETRQLSPHLLLSTPD